MNDTSRYDGSQKRRMAEHEAMCRRCGICCGSTDGDPCAELINNGDGTYMCGIYQARLGPRKTISGRSFNCVPVMENIRKGARYENCPYVKLRLSKHV